MCSRAIRQSNRDKPLRTIGSPPCTAFSRLQLYNANRGDPRDKQAKLEQAKEHIRFCIKLYRLQMKKGRYFLHEHPQGADSWQMEEVEQLPQEHLR